MKPDLPEPGTQVIEGTGDMHLVRVDCATATLCVLHDRAQRLKLRAAAIVLMRAAVYLLVVGGATQMRVQRGQRAEGAAAQHAFVRQSIEGSLSRVRLHDLRTCEEPVRTCDKAVGIGDDPVRVHLDGESIDLGA